MGRGLKCPYLKCRLASIYSSSLCQIYVVTEFEIEQQKLNNPDSGQSRTPHMINVSRPLHLLCTCNGFVRNKSTFGNQFSPEYQRSIRTTPLINHKCIMLAFCTLLARRLILCQWKDSSPPTYSQWITEDMQHLKLKMRYSLQGSILKSYAIWQPSFTFMEEWK